MSKSQTGDNGVKVKEPFKVVEENDDASDSSKR